MDIILDTDKIHTAIVDEFCFNALTSACQAMSASLAKSVFPGAFSDIKKEFWAPVTYWPPT